MSTGSQSPQSSLPPLALKTVNTTTWGTGGNTCTITDAYIHTNSAIHLWVTGSTPCLGNWSLTITQGQLVVTSTDAENAALAISYIVL